jgi:hypothetical protein
MGALPFTRLIRTVYYGHRSQSLEKMITVDKIFTLNVLSVQ